MFLGLSKCKLQEKKASAFSGSGLQPVGRFVPKCEADGSYSKIQCWSSTGYCWCVDKNGTELQGTRVRGMPVCPSQGRSSMYMLMQVYGAAQSKGFLVVGKMS